MFRASKRVKGFVYFVVFLATISIASSALAVAGEEGVPAKGHESANESTHEGSQEGSHGADRSADLRDLAYRSINFVLVVVILVLALRRGRVKSFFSARGEDIKQRLEDLQRQKEKAENKYREMAENLKGLEEKRKEIIEESKKEGLAEKERIIAEAKEKVRQIIEQADLTIQQEIQSARDRLSQEVVDLSAQKAQETIAKEITEKDQDRLVNEFIEKVGKLH